jgi:hypothetical protein
MRMTSGESQVLDVRGREHGEFSGGFGGSGRMLHLFHMICSGNEDRRWRVWSEVQCAELCRFTQRRPAQAGEMVLRM